MRSIFKNFFTPLIVLNNLNIVIQKIQYESEGYVIKFSSILIQLSLLAIFCFNREFYLILSVHKPILEDILLWLVLTITHWCRRWLMEWKILLYFMKIFPFYRDLLPEPFILEELNQNIKCLFSLSQLKYPW